jgi:colanic acid/amylovoran biosynthesis glycosyltransferase
MLHIYRQIGALQEVRPIVITQKRENELRFPFEPVYRVGKPVTHFLRRFWSRQLLKQPWQISRIELDSLRSILENTGSRLLHVYFGHIAVHLLPLIRAWPRPTVVSFHGADVLVDLDKPAYRRATEEMLRNVKRVFVRSESLRQVIAPLMPNENKISIVRTGVPLDEFPFRSRSAPENGRWQLLQAGRLIEKKGIDTSLRAFADFTKMFPNARLTIAGEGPLLEKLQNLAAELHTAGQLSFPGFLPQDKLRELFYASHIFVHPSQMGSDGNQEGVPNSMLEAMASGLPVFATRHGGIPEAIDDGISGVLVAERDHTALTRELVRAAQEPERLSRLARAGAESVGRKFERTAQVQNLERLYLETIQGC